MSLEQQSQALEASRRSAALDSARRIGPGGRGPMLSSWTDSTPALIRALQDHRDAINRAMDVVQVGGDIGYTVVDTFCEVRTLACQARQERSERPDA